MSLGQGAIGEFSLGELPSAVSGDTNVNATLGTLTLTTYGTTVNAATNVGSTLTTLTLTKYNATVDLTTDTNISASVGSLNLTPYNATVNSATDVEANLATLALTPYNASISTDSGISASVVALSITPYNAIVNAATGISAALATLNLTTYSATIDLVSGTNVNATSPVLAITPYNATVNAATNISAGVVSLSLTPYNASQAGLDLGVTIDGSSQMVMTTDYESVFLYFNNSNYFTLASTGEYEPVDATILKSADIGVTVQAYDVNTVSDVAYQNTEENYSTAEKGKLAGIESGATGDQTAGEIEAIVSHDNLQGVTANEHIDWTADQGVTNIHSGNYTDTDTTDHTLFSNIGTNSHAAIDTHIADSTQHYLQSAISITESQISDLGSYSLTSHNHDTAYLGISSKAADSELLDGLDSSDFSTSRGSQSSTVDFNTLTTPGTYKVVNLSTCTNSPYQDLGANIYEWGYLVVSKVDSTNWVVQKYYSDNADDVCFRARWGGTWRPWKAIGGSYSNADTLDGISSSGFATSSHTHTFASLTSKPTTLAGYGITDAQSYDADIPTVVVSQVEAEAGTSTANRTWTPQRVKQAIDALGGSGGSALKNLTTYSSSAQSLTSITWNTLWRSLFEGTDDYTIYSGDNSSLQAPTGSSRVQLSANLSWDASVGSLTEVYLQIRMYPSGEVVGMGYFDERTGMGDNMLSITTPVIPVSVGQKFRVYAFPVGTMTALTSVGAGQHNRNSFSLTVIE